MNCAKCGKPGALHIHVDAHPGLLCDNCQKAARVVCDFCAINPAAWEFPCRDFHLDEFNFRSIDNYLACERCATLVMIENYRKLEDLACEYAGVPLVGHRSVRRRKLSSALLYNFARNRTGQPFRIDEQGKPIEENP